MTNNNIYYYGGVYPVQTSKLPSMDSSSSSYYSNQSSLLSSMPSSSSDYYSNQSSLLSSMPSSSSTEYSNQSSLLSPVHAETSTDLRDESSGDRSSSYERLQDKKNGNTVPQNNYFHNLNSASLDSDLATRTESQKTQKSCFKQRLRANRSPSSLSKSDDSGMDYEIYQSSLIKNALAPCPLQVSIEENDFRPRATSTPTMSPDNSNKTSPSILHTPGTPRRAVKRKVRFCTEEDEAVYHLQTKYLNTEN